MGAESEALQRKGNGSQAFGTAPAQGAQTSWDKTKLCAEETKQVTSCGQRGTVGTLRGRFPPVSSTLRRQSSRETGSQRRAEESAARSELPGRSHLRAAARDATGPPAP